MKLSLLATKTYLPPIPEHHIARARLEERLEVALRGHHRLILISAPPGAGKSSLLAGAVIKWSLAGLFGGAGALFLALVVWTAFRPQYQMVGEILAERPERK